MGTRIKIYFYVFILMVTSGFLSFPFLGNAAGATLYLSPGTGSFLVGSTFDVSIVLNTGEEAVNTVEVELKFSADKIQLVNPSVGRSIIQIWATQPVFSNKEGKIYFVGGIPSPGIKTPQGIVTTMTFRAVAPGSGSIKFLDKSSVLANDGFGTNILRVPKHAFYTFNVPPPVGPQISSPTHPDETRWYKDPNPTLIWTKDPGVTGFSYAIDQDPNGFPDTKEDTKSSQVSLENLESGLWYFHLRANSGGIWGGTSHYILQIDTNPPASFPVNVSPGKRTTTRNPILRFFTTDSTSGFDHFELKVVPLKISSQEETPFFFEVSSPYQLTPLEPGRYTGIVRAFDMAGNWRDEEVRLTIISSFWQFFTDEGVDLIFFFVPWSLLLIITAIIVSLILILIAVLWWLHHPHIHGHAKEDWEKLKGFISRKPKEAAKKEEFQSGVNPALDDESSGLATRITRDADIGQGRDHKGFKGGVKEVLMESEFLPQQEVSSEKDVWSRPEVVIQPQGVLPPEAVPKSEEVTGPQAKPRTGISPLPAGGLLRPGESIFGIEKRMQEAIKSVIREETAETKEEKMKANDKVKIFLAEMLRPSIEEANEEMKKPLLEAKSEAQPPSPVLEKNVLEKKSPLPFHSLYSRLLRKKGPGNIPGGLLVIFLMLGTVLVFSAVGSSVFNAKFTPLPPLQKVAAIADGQDRERVVEPTRKAVVSGLTTPIISISPDTFYTLDELLYIEGRALPNSAVTVYLQRSGERSVKLNVKSDSAGEWSLAEKVFLSGGDWEVRARMMLASGDISDWSNPRVIRSIVTGFTILGVTIKYLTIALVLFLLFAAALSFLIYSIMKVKKIREFEKDKKREEEIKVLQQKVLEGEVATVHATIADGFSTLRHDLINELKSLEEQSRLTGQPLSSSEVEKREHIIKELYEIEEEIGKKLKEVKGSA